MCNLYRLKVERWELLEHYGAQDEWLADLDKPYVSPGRPAPVIIQGTQRALMQMTWGWPNPRGGKPVVNVRNYDSPFWRSALGNPERRCLVPFTAFQEWSVEPDPETGKKRPHDFVIPSRKIGTFAGIWRPSEAGPIFAFLTCGYDGDAQEHVVGRIHPKAIPVILHDEDFDRWLTAPIDDAIGLACAFPSQLLAVS